MIDSRSMERDEAKYSRIWKSMEHCVDVCIFSTFRNATEMLYGGNWKVVHERCKYIIEKHMKELRIDDPHEFDKAVCWQAVSTGKDRDPTWRCVCAFFFAAAMELVMVRRLNEDKFKKVESGKQESEVDDVKRQLRDILREMQASHGDIHTKLDKIRSGQGIAQTQVAQTQVHVNNHITHPGSAQSPDDFFKRIVEFMRSKGNANNGYDPSGSRDDSQFPT